MLFLRLDALTFSDPTVRYYYYYYYFVLYVYYHFLAVFFVFDGTTDLARIKVD